jgi:hypothetical protein
MIKKTWKSFSVCDMRMVIILSCTAKKVPCQEIPHAPIRPLHGRCTHRSKLTRYGCRAY